jgi:hypothetical protein
MWFEHQAQIGTVRTGRRRALARLAAFACVGALGGSVSVGAATATTYEGNPVAGGWGALNGYLGRYHLSGAVAGAPAAATSPPSAGIFSVALSAADHLSTPTRVTGELSVFIRKVKTGEPYAPSGVMSVFDSSGSNVLYLTDLAVHHGIRTADVLGGSFLGVPTGHFTAHASGTTMTIGLQARGIGTVTGRLTRFSINPAP